AADLLGWEIVGRPGRWGQRLVGNLLRVRLCVCEGAEMGIGAVAAVAAPRLFLIASRTVARPRTVGQATSANDAVTGVIGALEQALTTGDKVSGNETVKTGIKSAALLQFLDNSKLNIGASSTVLLDRFVYNSDASARNGIVKLTSGALRFASG